MRIKTTNKEDMVYISPSSFVFKVKNEQPDENETTSRKVQGSIRFTDEVKKLGEYSKDIEINFVSFSFKPVAPLKVHLGKEQKNFNVDIPANVKDQTFKKGDTLEIDFHSEQMIIYQDKVEGVSFKLYTYDAKNHEQEVKLPITLI